MTSAASSWRRGKATTEEQPGHQINVVVRVRPPLPQEAQYGHCARIVDGRRVVVTTSSGQVAHGTPQKQRDQVVDCSCDHVFDMKASQEDVWQAVEPLVEKAVEGYSATFFTYGMTGTGKTYSMLGPRFMESSFTGRPPPTPMELVSCENRGIVPRVVQRIFESVCGGRFGSDAPTITMSYVQIYMERCYDLLRPASAMTPLRVREEGGGSVYVEGLSEVEVLSAETCYQYLVYGFSNIVFRSTAFNEQSSRSHSILTLTIARPVRDPATGRRLVRKSKINLVDLAGNERWNSFGPAIDRSHARELVTINRSLHTLGACVQALSQTSVVSKRAGRQAPRHIPYRDSALTLILRESFSGNHLVTMLCTVCSSTLYQVQTICTLRFAGRAKRVQMKARRVEPTDLTERMQNTQAEIEYLRSVVASGGASAKLQQQVKKLETQNGQLEDENQTLRTKLDELEMYAAANDYTEAPLKRHWLRRAISEPSLGRRAFEDDDDAVIDEDFASIQVDGDNNDSVRAQTSRVHFQPRNSRTLPPPCQTTGLSHSQWLANELGGSSCHSSEQNLFSPKVKPKAGRDCGNPARGPCCPTGHALALIGSQSCVAAYAEWHCDSGRCKNGSVLTPGIGRYHCAQCQHDLCEVCCDQAETRSACSSTPPKPASHNPPPKESGTMASQVASPRHVLCLPRPMVSPHREESSVEQIQRFVDFASLPPQAAASAAALYSTPARPRRKGARSFSLGRHLDRLASNAYKRASAIDAAAAVAAAAAAAPRSARDCAPIGKHLGKAPLMPAESVPQNPASRWQMQNLSERKCLQQSSASRAPPLHLDPISVSGDVANWQGNCAEVPRYRSAESSGSSICWAPSIASTGPPTPDEFVVPAKRCHQVSNAAVGTILPAVGVDGNLAMARAARAAGSVLTTSTPRSKRPVPVIKPIETPEKHLIHLPWEKLPQRSKQGGPDGFVTTPASTDSTHFPPVVREAVKCSLALDGAAAGMDLTPEAPRPSADPDLRINVNQPSLSVALNSVVEIGPSASNALQTEDPAVSKERIARSNAAAKRLAALHSRLGLNALPSAQLELSAVDAAVNAFAATNRDLFGTTLPCVLVPSPPNFTSGSNLLEARTDC